MSLKTEVDAKYFEHFRCFRCCISKAASEHYRVLTTTGILSKCRINVCWILIVDLPIISSLFLNVYLSFYTFKLSIWCSKGLSDLTYERTSLNSAPPSLPHLPLHLCHPTSWKTIYTFSFCLINSLFRDPTVSCTYIHTYIHTNINT